MTEVAPTAPQAAPQAEGMDVATLGSRAKVAAKALARASTTQKDAALSEAAAALRRASGEILAANARDLAAGERSGLTPSQLDRLRLSADRVEAMATGLEKVMALPDPIGAIESGWVRPNGLRVRRVRVPLGVVAVIYENRPNVTSDAAGLCLKSGNAAFLRGSSTAMESNIAIATALREGVQRAGLPADSIVLMDDPSRDAATQFMQLRGVVDCLIPRGGASLISAIRQHATVPFIIDGDGNCHIYVDRAADLAMAERIIVNAKTQRPSVCNAAESLLVHGDVAAEFLPRAQKALPGVTLLGDESARRILPDIDVATEDDFDREFLDLTLSVAVVDDIDVAIEHIATHGSGHSEAIVTQDLGAATRFTNQVDAAAVLVNASTRFIDGEELGFGAEIGISTQKLHCRGPMGLEQLTTLKYVVEGNGQVRS